MTISLLVCPSIKATQPRSSPLERASVANVCRVWYIVRGVGKDPVAAELAGRALGSEGAINGRLHLDIADRGHGLRGALTPAGDRPAHADQLPMPVEAVPPQANLLARPETREEGDREVPPQRFVRQTPVQEQPDLLEREGEDLRLVFPESLDLARRIALEPPALYRPVER
jgi:hypothetical protein